MNVGHFELYITSKVLPENINLSEYEFSLDDYKIYVIPRKTCFDLYFTPFGCPFITEAVTRFCKDKNITLAMTYDAPRRAGKIVLHSPILTYQCFKFLTLYVAHKLYKKNYVNEELF